MLRLALDLHNGQRSGRSQLSGCSALYLVSRCSPWRNSETSPGTTAEPQEGPGELAVISQGLPCTRFSCVMLWHPEACRHLFSTFPLCRLCHIVTNALMHYCFKTQEKHAQWSPPKHAVREIQRFTHVIVPKESQENEAAPQAERHSEKFAKLARRPKDYQASTHTPLGKQHNTLCFLACILVSAEGDTTVTMLDALLHVPALALW